MPATQHQEPYGYSVTIQQRLRRNYPRSKTGCLVCRSRRKKCDERKPICTGCQCNGRQCVWPVIQVPAVPQRCVIEAGPRSALHTAEREATSLHTSTATSPGTNGIDTMLPTGVSTSGHSIVPSQPNSLYILEGSSSFPPPLVDFSSLSPQLSTPLGCGRPPLLTPYSSTLFAYYLANTTGQIAVDYSNNNPFITYVLPLAFSDDLIMHCVLALGGVHLCYDDTLNADLKTATWSHYSCALRDLRVALSGNMTDQARDPLHLLLICLLLCLVEVISGNSNGAIFYHLHASRHLVLSILPDPSRYKSRDQRNLWGFVLEIYAYLVLLGSIGPAGLAEDQTLIVDPFLTSLEALREYETYGIMFACGHGLFEIIPHIHQLKTRRLVEEERGICSIESLAIYKSLESRIQSWLIPESLSQRSELSGQRKVAAAIYQNTLLLFLHGLFSSSTARDPKVVDKIENLVKGTIHLLDSVSLSPLYPILLWPTMTIGSYLKDIAQQNWLRVRMLNSKIKMTCVKRGVELLDLLWEDPDSRAYGPYGLDFVMKKRGIYFCMS